MVGIQKILQCISPNKVVNGHKRHHNFYLFVITKIWHMIQYLPPIFSNSKCSFNNISKWWMCMIKDFIHTHRLASETKVWYVRDITSLCMASYILSCEDILCLTSKPCMHIYIYIYHSSYFFACKYYLVYIYHIYFIIVISLLNANL
jgi:hypothetical protein